MTQLDYHSEAITELTHEALLSDELAISVPHAVFNIIKDIEAAIIFTHILRVVTDISGFMSVEYEGERYHMISVETMCRNYGIKDPDAYMEIERKLVDTGFVKIVHVKEDYPYVKIQWGKFNMALRAWTANSVFYDEDEGTISWLY